MVTIQVNEATISTVSVKIQTLSVSGRQVTLALFRQLKSDTLIEAGQFMGVPWGSVNYHSKDCMGGTHLHIVWQLGDELRQATEEPPIALGRKYYEVPWAQKWLDAAVLSGWKPSAKPAYGQSCDVQFKAGTASIEPLDGVRDYWENLDGTYDYARTQRERARGKIQQRADSYNATEETLQERVQAAVREERHEREEAIMRWQELKALPQLFIAV